MGKKKKTQKVVITFTNGRFVIPVSAEKINTREDNTHDKIDFANYMVNERRKSMIKRRRARRR